MSILIKPQDKSIVLTDLDSEAFIAYRAALVAQLNAKADHRKAFEELRIAQQRERDCRHKVEDADVAVLEAEDKLRKTML